MMHTSYAFNFFPLILLAFMVMWVVTVVKGFMFRSGKCPTCGHNRRGNFCARCGQKQDAVKFGRFG